MSKVLYVDKEVFEGYTREMEDKVNLIENQKLTFSGQISTLTAREKGENALADNNGTLETFQELFKNDIINLRNLNQEIVQFDENMGSMNEGGKK